MNINANDPWYNTNLGGTYRFVDMYNNYPVYKVSYHIILSHVDTIQKIVRWWNIRSWLNGILEFFWVTLNYTLSIPSS